MSIRHKIGYPGEDVKTLRSTMVRLLDLVDSLGVEDMAQPGDIKASYRTADHGGWLCMTLGTGNRIVNIADWPRLFEVLGTAHGGDGTTTFGLPDGSEAALVGVGSRSAGVTAHDTYTLGQFKDDQLQGHRMGPLSPNTNIWGTSTGGTSGSYGSATNLKGAVSTGDPVTDGTNGDPRTGAVTRGKRLGVHFFIRAI